VLQPSFFSSEKNMQNRKKNPFFVAEESALMPLVKLFIYAYRNTTIDRRTI
jgi:hypothetical protein